MDEKTTERGLIPHTTMTTGSAPMAQKGAKRKKEIQKAQKEHGKLETGPPVKMMCRRYSYGA